jgi:hypothetical protein
MPGKELDRLRTMARVLDDWVRVPGTRFRIGLDALIGLIPGAGDVVTGAASVYALLAAARLGAPPSVVVRMAGNIVVDLVIGALPVLGDLFDAGWKSNRRNLALLERLTEDRRAATTSSRAVVAAAVVLVVATVAGAAYFTVWIVQQLLGLG